MNVAAGRPPICIRDTAHRGIWGDGFVDDGWVQLLRVSTWTECCEDELFRKFPHLRHAACEPWPALLQSAFARVLDSVQHGARLQCEVDGDPPGCLGMPSRRVQAARHVGLLARCPAQSTVPAFDETSASSFAFLTNVYAAYIWPTKLLAHDRFATLCWRGHVERRKRAFMPLEVANYLGEVLGEARDCGKVIAHDLSDFIVSDVMLHDLRRAAERRLHANGIAFTYRSPIGRWACGRLRWL